MFLVFDLLLEHDLDLGLPMRLPQAGQRAIAPSAIVQPPIIPLPTRLDKMGAWVHAFCLNMLSKGIIA